MNPKNALLIVAAAVMLGGAVRAQNLTIENDALAVTWARESGRLSAVAKPSGQPFLKDVRVSEKGADARVLTMAHKAFGTGQALEISYSDRRDTVMIFPRLPFALFKTNLRNRGKDATVTRSVTNFTLVADWGQPVAGLKTLGTGGLLAPDKNPGSYVWLAVAEPHSRNGIVFGWLTHDRGSGVLFTGVRNNAVTVEARLDYGQLRLAAGQVEELETIAVGYFEDARFGLEAWADAVARVYDIHLPPQPVGYCTWYSRPHGGAADEKSIVELAAFAATNLAPYGFSVVQIDDKWQAGVSTNGPKRNFTTHNPEGPYPEGMKSSADRIKAMGLVPGLWYMPFAGTYYDPFFVNHEDWFVKRGNGQPYETAWGGTCLDMTHPGARAHLQNVTHRICHEWGYQYVKIDGLWTGTGTKQQYVNSGFKEDQMGDAVFHDPNKSNIQAYRDGLRLVREAAGSDVFILGCNGPQNMRSYGGAMGLVDGMRVGPDNGTDWNRLLRGPLFSSRQYFLHGRIWYNDPDPVYVRTNIPLQHARLICSFVTLSGQLNLSSEWLPALPPERLEILRRTMPNHGLLPRPADLFEREPASLWTVMDTRRTPHRNVIAVFNWDRREQQFDCPLERLGLVTDAEYAVFDFWRNELLPMMKSRLQLTVPAESCAVLAVRPVSDRPQVLSTSRHVTQGMVDLLEERWNESTWTLHGRSKVVGGDPYELRIVAGSGDQVGLPKALELSSEDRQAGVIAGLAPAPGLVRARLESPVSREVVWSVRFR